MKVVNMQIPYHGILVSGSLWLSVGGPLLVLAALGFYGAPLWLWTLALLGILFSLGTPIWICGIVLAVLLIWNITPIRRNLISSPLLKLVTAMGVAPQISET